MNKSPQDSLQEVLASDQFIRLNESKTLRIDLRYASTNNFLGRNLYQEFRFAFLHKVAAEKFARAQEFLEKKHPELRFLVFDALRPRSIQRVMWDAVAGTEGQNYFANPDNGSIHNWGFAVDLTLETPINERSGLELDMGTPFDSFSELAHPRQEEKFLGSGELSKAQHANRLILREAMLSAGFTQLPTEWWHFDAITRAEAKEKFKIIE